MKGQSNPVPQEHSSTQGEKISSPSAPPTSSFSAALQNSRVKVLKTGDYPIIGDNELRIVGGVWLPESNDPAKALVFREQAKITCTSSDKTCRELTVPLGSLGDMAEIMDVEEKDWPIISWDERGLLASYGPDPSKTAAASDRRHSHILTMTFGSGAVSTSDIPTHEKRCEEFKETDSYRLVRGNYYVDTSPENNLDKRK